MLSHERQRELLRHIRSRGVGNVNDLADELGVSPSTIRRDLKEMDTQGLLNRVHGGASLPENDLEAARITRQTERAAEKRRIGEAASTLVEDHATVLITGGTTTEAMLPFLAGREGVTVLTNGLNVAHALTRQPDVSVVVLGGILRHGEMSLLGPLAEQAMDEFRVDLAFTGTYGIDPEVGITGASVHEASTDRKLLQAVDRLVVLADSTKFGKRGPVRLAPVDRIGYLVTDAAAPLDAVQALADAGVDVRLV